MVSPGQESAKFLCDVPQNKYFKHRRLYVVSITTTQLCHHSVKGAIDSMERNEHGIVRVKFYL